MWKLLRFIGLRRVDRKFSPDSKISLIAFVDKGHKELVEMPEEFDLARHLEEFPPTRYGFPASRAFEEYKVYTFFFLLSSIPARNRDLIDENGYVPIFMARVRDGIKDIKLYIDYLTRTGVIDVDRQYYEGKSRGYKWSREYDNSPRVIREVETRFADDIYKYQKSTTDFTEYPYLFHWYAQKKLNISDLASGYAREIKEMKMRDTSRASWDWNNDKDTYKNPVTQYNAALYNIGKLQYHYYEAHIDDNIHRLHSVLTNLQKELRNFVSYDGLELANIDINNSQPYLISLILNPDFWAEDSELPVNINNLPENISSLYTDSVELRDAIQLYFHDTEISAFEEYKRIVSSGRFYEHIQEVCNRRVRGEGEPEIKRKDAKILMFNILFGTNRGRQKDKKIGKMKRLFAGELFPEVAQLFSIIKANYPDSPLDKPHSRLALILQAIESQIILHKCCKRIWDEKGGTIPIFTIHDSIATVVEHTDYVERIMREELRACIGIDPKLSREEWNESASELSRDIMVKISTPASA